MPDSRASLLLALLLKIVGEETFTGERKKILIDECTALCASSPQLGWRAKDSRSGPVNKNAPRNSTAVPTERLTEVPFSKAANIWLESRRAYIAPRTFHEYELNIKTLTTYFAEMRLHEITGDQVRAYQKARMVSCGPFGINHECGILLQMRKRIGMPFDDYQPLPLPKEKRGRALRDEQKAKLFQLAASNPNWQAACLFARISVNTTAGPKETMTLRLKDVELENRIVKIQPEGAKNVYRVRRIPLNDDAFEAATLAVERAKRLGSVDPDHYLFPFWIHRSLFDPTRHQTTFKTAWRKLIAAAGLPGFRMYDLRHHAITVLLENPEVSEETCEALAGHISKEMKKRYSHTRMERMREAVEAMAKKPVKRERAGNDRSGGNAEQILVALAKLLKIA